MRLTDERLGPIDATAAVFFNDKARRENVVPSDDPFSSIPAFEVALAKAPPKAGAGVNGGPGADALYTGHVQILLAEKRTSLALLRTGIAVSLVPLSIWTVLIATSRMWEVFQVLPLLLPVLIIALALLAVGVRLVVHSMRHLAHVDGKLEDLRKKSEALQSLLYEEHTLALPRPHVRRRRRKFA